MRFYQATRFIFPRHYERRVLAVCFIATHVPLLACIAWQASTGAWNGTVLLILLAATLAGTMAAIVAIGALLAPLGRATSMLQSVQRGVPVAPLPAGGDDVVGQLLRAVAVAANENALRIERLVDAAERDLLTGLRNRRGFLDAIAPILDRAEPAVIALIDLDRFKLVNDRYGHDRGDELLAAFGRHLIAALRRSDISARWGGEEFAILFPATTIDQAREIMERLRQTMTADRGIMLEGRALTFSSGLASLTDVNGLADAMRQADRALYSAKEDGRDRIAIAA